MSERLRRWTRNSLGSARRGSNPLGVELPCHCESTDESGRRPVAFVHVTGPRKIPGTISYCKRSPPRAVLDGDREHILVTTNMSLLKHVEMSCYPRTRHAHAWHPKSFCEPTCTFFAQGTSRAVAFLDAGLMRPDENCVLRRCVLIGAQRATNLRRAILYCLPVISM